MQKSKSSQKCENRKMILSPFMLLATINILHFHCHQHLVMSLVKCVAPDTHGQLLFLVSIGYTSIVISALTPDCGLFCVSVQLNIMTIKWCQSREKMVCFQTCFVNVDIIWMEVDSFSCLEEFPYVGPHSYSAVVSSPQWFVHFLLLEMYYVALRVFLHTFLQVNGCLVCCWT